MNSQPNLQAAFRRFDTDSDGMLAFDEFHAALCNFIGLVRDADSALLFKAFDLNEEGRVSIQVLRDGVYRPAGYRARVYSLLENSATQQAVCHQRQAWKAMGGDEPKQSNAPSQAAVGRERRRSGNPEEKLKRLLVQVLKKGKRLQTHVPRWERLRNQRSELLMKLGRRVLEQAFEAKDEQDASGLPTGVLQRCAGSLCSSTATSDLRVRPAGRILWMGYAASSQVSTCWIKSIHLLCCHHHFLDAQRVWVVVD